jgi:hypothetical protein
MAGSALVGVLAHAWPALDDIAASAAFLAGPESSFITGNDVRGDRRAALEHGDNCLVSARPARQQRNQRTHSQIGGAHVRASLEGAASTDHVLGESVRIKLRETIGLRQPVDGRESLFYQA